MIFECVFSVAHEHPNLNITWKKLYKVISQSKLDDTLYIIENDIGVVTSYSEDFFRKLTKKEEQKLYREDKLKRILK